MSKIHQKAQTAQHNLPPQVLHKENILPRSHNFILEISVKITMETEATYGKILAQAFLVDEQQKLGALCS